MPLGPCPSRLFPERHIGGEYGRISRMLQQQDRNAGERKVTGTITAAGGRPVAEITCQRCVPTHAVGCMILREGQSPDRGARHPMVWIDRRIEATRVGKGTVDDEGHITGTSGYRPYLSQTRPDPSL